MELLEGETLSQLMDRERKLAPIHAVQLLLPVADALSAAHAKGLVHRDVKPDNVLLIHADEGMVQPKLLDFGIVKSAQDSASASSEAGSVVGSPDYMSPEQARGLEHVDSRSDLWSFSVVLYETIAGIVPFQATDYATLLRKIVQEEPRTLEELGAAGHALSYIVARGLSKDPMARYSSINQMGRALAAWLADQGISEDACGVSLETKWLARQTDPIGFGRASWPPAPRTEHSGVHNLSLMLAPPPSIQVPSVTIPPSSFDPVETEPRSVKPAGRRSVVTIAAVSLVATTLACFGIAGLVSRGERAPAGVVISSRSIPAEEEPTASPVAIATTVLPAASAKPATLAPLATVAPAPIASVDQPEVPAPRTATARPSRPAKSAAPAPKQKQERLSDLLAPMPF
jgi:serine/threonine-protein kinase